jgi:hypothetical protein
MTKTSTDNLKKGITIKKWQKNRTEQMRIVLSRFQDRTFISLRVWYFDPEKNGYKPGRVGINLETKHLNQIAEGMRKARKKALALGLDTTDPVA